VEEHRPKNLLDQVLACAQLAEGMPSASNTISMAPSRPALVNDFLSFGDLSGMGNELLNLQRFTLGRIADQVDGLPRVVGDAHIAAHARAIIDSCKSVIYGNRRKLAGLGTRSAGCLVPLL
jgi:hypothetical protein